MKANTFDIFITREKKIIEKAQILRQKVFFDKEGRDSDIFDKFCEHLVAIDNQTAEVIGTYRLLLGSVAAKNEGFYSETEFDLSSIKKSCRGELLEMGRACVKKSHRSLRIIILMWQEILKFVVKNKVQFIFGCASVHNPSPKKIGELCAFFKKECFSPPHIRVYPIKGKEYPYENITDYNSKEIFSLLPSLIKEYLNLGAFVGGEPVWDKQFHTADFFMLADTNNKVLLGMKKKLLP